MLKRLLVKREPDPLTFVMSVTLKEGQRLGSTESWRNAPDTGAALRLRFALQSLWDRFDLDSLCEIMLVCPEDQIEEVITLVRTVTHDERIRVISELDVCPDIVRCVDPATGSIRGWYAQQMLKMAVAERVTTPFYVTLDTDVACIRPFSSADLLDQGRGICGMESVEFYERIYTPSFAKTETRVRETRVKKVGELLGYERKERYVGRYPSETPLQFHTASMCEMLTHLSERHGKPWTQLLARDESWTEIYLYFHYLEMAGLMEKIHSVYGPNKVLHAEGSVWQANDRYAQDRTYDVAHFEQVLADDDGLFIAVQSWLDEGAWLPATGYATLEEFYEHLGRVLDVELA